jgi:hypothetical protein
MEMLGQIQNKSEVTALDTTMAKATLNFKKDDQFVSEYEDEQRIEGQGFYRLAKVYYDKSDLRKAEEFFIKSLERTSFPETRSLCLRFTVFNPHLFRKSTRS